MMGCIVLLIYFYVPNPYIPLLLSLFYSSIVYLIGNYFDFHYAFCKGQELDMILKETAAVLRYFASLSSI